MSDGPLAILTDLHLEPDHAGATLEALDVTLEAIRAEDPSELIVLGDIVQEANHQADIEFLQRFRERLAATEFPFHCLPGNHDVEHLSSERFSETVGNPCWSVDEQRGHVYLDSSAPRLPGGRGELSSEQCSALREALTTLESVTVFVHHPLHYQYLGDNYWFSEHPEEAFCGNKRAVREILEPNAASIEAVVCGHLHEWGYTRVDGIDHFVIDAFNKRLNPNGETGAYAILETAPRLQLTHHAGDGRVQTVSRPE